jgi:hypothetical protein
MLIVKKTDEDFRLILKHLTSYLQYISNILFHHSSAINMEFEKEKGEWPYYNPHLLRIGGVTTLGVVLICLLVILLWMLIF